MTEQSFDAGSDDDAVAGESAGYVPCLEEASDLPATDDDSQAVAGNETGRIPDAQEAFPEDAPDDADPIEGREVGFVAKPCVEDDCITFDSFNRTVSGDWGSNTEGTWTKFTDGFDTLSVDGSYGVIDLTTGNIFDLPTLDMIAVSSTLRTNAPWTLRARFSLDNEQSGGVSSLMFLVDNVAAGDVASVQFQTGSGLHRAQLVALENGSYVGGQGFLNVDLYNGDGFHEMRWVFTPGPSGTQTVYLDGALILTGPSFTYSSPSYLSNTLLKLRCDSLGTLELGKKMTVLFDFIEFCP